MLRKYASGNDGHRKQTNCNILDFDIDTLLLLPKLPGEDIHFPQQIILMSKMIWLKLVQPQGDHLSELS